MHDEAVKQYMRDRRLQLEPRPAGPAGDLKHYVRVSVYRFKPDTADRLIAEAERSLLPLFRGQPGFVAHQIVKTGPDEVVAVSTWDSREGAERSVDIARAWVEARARDLLVSVDTRFGEAVVDYEQFHEGAYDAAGALGESG